ncbi:protein kinase domain-containing protein [Dictyobacter aurantiacus]|uniref:Protein kinase domain-containing protein n=1 Tax=Dictyobacter aurantiacus TaxID=1936993 RepID=A0A401ZFL6_9CHLR|nr:protein kinase [Dictyobacter aurantiacus]GCE05478.1 hypothetical protein KDAU_28070 [Dictyobacter aurantiacus]
MADYVGQQFGPYHLLRLLGQGGFADVYLGEHIHVGSMAAIKILYARLIDEYHERFLNEARTLARLSHPHIVRMHDFGIKDGIPFLIMEYAPHGTLRQQHPSRTKVPLSTVVNYVNQIADGLQCAHDQNLIHRDLKPSNVLIGQKNNLLLSDFGVALIAQTTYSQSIEKSVVGTIAYVAPEQLQGRPQLASDQYSLGVMTYEWLCGTRPFLGTVIEMWAQHQSAVPAPLRQYVPDLPPEVEQVVLTALAKDPGQRFANVRAFANALEAASRPDHIPVATMYNLPLTSEQAANKDAIRIQAADRGFASQPVDITDPDEAGRPPDEASNTEPDDRASQGSVPIPAPSRRGGNKKKIGITAAIVAVVALLLVSTLVYTMNGEAANKPLVVATATAMPVQQSGNKETAAVSQKVAPTPTSGAAKKTTQLPILTVSPTSKGAQTPPAARPTPTAVAPTPTPTPTAAAPTSFAVDGRNPTTYSVGGKTCAATQSNSTPKSFNVGGITGTLYFQFSYTCHAAWAKVVFSQAVPGKYGNAKIVRNNDGATYTCSNGGNGVVALGQTSCYTGMVYDGPTQTASAYASFTFSSGQTDVSSQLGPY